MASLLWVMDHDASAPGTPTPFQWLEWQTHDWRVRWNFRREAPTAATNFAVILIDDQTSAYLSKAIANDAPRWPFSHLYHGKLVEELKQQGVAAVAFDVFWHPG